jgi:hypothetical protein
MHMETLLSNDQQKALLAAADFFNQSARQLLTIDGRLHAETLIASVARMAGSMMYRSFNFDKAIEPGTAVLSDQANIHGPKLMNVMFVTLQQLGDKVGQDSLNSEYASAKFSQLTFRESHDRLAPFFLKYCEVTPMALQDAALGAAIATGILVHDCREVLSADKGSAIAVYGFVEGTKTAPFPLASGENPSPPSTASAEKKPWYKVW